MDISRQILRLNYAGLPIGWITYQTAVRLYYNDQVTYECGNSSLLVRGGINRVTGLRSKIEVNSIIATKNYSKVSYSDYTPPLTNLTLFHRDTKTCMYCGETFTLKNLSRDHVIPLSKGGEDKWTNLVTACKGCNNKKGDRTPEQAGMPLLAVPFIPSRVEYLILRGRTILADQMDFLLSHVPKTSRIRKRFTKR
jgi:5-methylcytosine-specific restriction endonuclease McrA